MIAHLLCSLVIGRSQHEQARSSAQLKDTTTATDCTIYKFVGANDLSVNDIVVKSESGDLACIKAKFSLAIKVETDSSDSLVMGTSERRPAVPGRISSNQRLVLGYLPLDSVVSVKNNCPRPMHHNELEGKHGLNELEMLVSFDCGNLTFSFKRDQNFYLSAIRGLVNLDSSTVRKFEVERPMFATSDLAHHFKSNDVLQVNSTANSKAFILTANFYNLEFETFRNTSSREFILPPDDITTRHITNG